MNLSALRNHLEQSFQPSVAARLDAVFRLAAGEHCLTFRVDRGTLSFDLPPDAKADATFLFRDEQTAWALLTGKEDAFEAFMDGRFRSDGYLMWAFALMAMFRSASLPANPIE